MIKIENVYVEKDILTKPFLCDIAQCLGKCCTFYGECGAPLSQMEVPMLNEHIPLVQHLLSDRTKLWLKEHGATEYLSNTPTTVCIEHRDCVFVYYEVNSKIALCAIENIYFTGKTTFRKPISCGLYPIRMSSYDDSLYLYYSKIKECASAVKNGKQKNVKIYQALEEPLSKFFGEEGYKKLEAEALKV